MTNTAIHLVRTTTITTVAGGNASALDNTVDITSLLNNLAGDEYRIHVKESKITWIITAEGSYPFAAEGGVAVVENGGAVTNSVDVLSTIKSTGSRLNASIDSHFNYVKLFAKMSKAYAYSDDSYEHSLRHTSDITKYVRTAATKIAESVNTDEPYLVDYIRVDDLDTVAANQFYVYTLITLDYELKGRTTPKGLFP